MELVSAVVGGCAAVLYGLLSGVWVNALIVFARGTYDAVSLWRCGKFFRHQLIRRRLVQTLVLNAVLFALSVRVTLWWFAAMDAYALAESQKVSQKTAYSFTDLFSYPLRLLSEGSHPVPSKKRYQLLYAVCVKPLNFLGVFSAASRLIMRATFFLPHWRLLSPVLRERLWLLFPKLAVVAVQTQYVTLLMINAIWCRDILDVLELQQESEQKRRAAATPGTLRAEHVGGDHLAHVSANVRQNSGLGVETTTRSDVTVMFGLAEISVEPTLFGDMLIPVADALSKRVIAWIWNVVCIVLFLIPYVGAPCYWFNAALLYAYYCFDARWQLLNFNVLHRVHEMESCWVYFLGFSLPLVLLAHTFGRFFEAGVLGAVYPILMLCALETTPLQVPVRHPQCRASQVGYPVPSLSAEKKTSAYLCTECHTWPVVAERLLRPLSRLQSAKMLCTQVLTRLPVVAPVLELTLIAIKGLMRLASLPASLKFQGVFQKFVGAREKTE